MSRALLFSAIILFLLLILPSAADAETFAVYTEESLNDETVPLPLPVKEGILDSLFEMEHIAFDLGPPDLKVDWQQPDFSMIISLAVQWGASYLILSRAQTAMGEETEPMVQSDVKYYIIEVCSGKLIDQDQLSGNNSGREAELDYQALCYNLGSELAEETIAKKLWLDSCQ